MLTKIQNKMLGVFYNIDIFSQDNNIVTLKGWIFSYKHKMDNIRFVFKDQSGKIYKFEGLSRIRRNDVYNAFLFDNAINSGFYVAAIAENCSMIDVWIEYSIKGKVHKLSVGKLSNPIINKERKAIITEMLTSTMGVDLSEYFEIENNYRFKFPEKYYEESIDLIVPVYNGYKFLENLFQSIPRTKMRYHLYIIDDKSPDERVYPYLKKYAKGKENVTLLQNPENLGFLKTVNRGLELCKNHVVLVNTDIELPNLWLERLILPILEDKKVATTTPYTTCGTICSFPEFLKDNKLFLNLSVDQIDSEFMKVKPKYAEMPTGVGYCMGMSKESIQEVGLLDEQHFGKGYGEENDWCQRAIKCGYKNVHVENLFVFHNHGGSFPSEEKKKLLAEHEKQLLLKHPEYNADVARYCVLDPNKDIRELVELNLLQKFSRKHTVLAFDHMLGGGATNYLEKKRKEILSSDGNMIIVRYNYFKDLYEIQYYYENKVIKSFLHVKKGIPNIIRYFSMNEIWINELVTYPNLYLVLNDIRESAEIKNVPIKMLFHDFFAVCPTINLLDQTEKYCNLPDCSVCKKCIGNNPSYQSLNMESMQKWREEWSKFLVSCNQVVVFSHNTELIVKKVYDNLNNIKVIPHQISYLPTVKKKYKTTKTLNVGLLGVLSKHKGEKIIEELIGLIKQENLQIRICLIGRAEHIKSDGIFKQTGSYTRDSIPRLYLENDIDVFFVPSIWPETFSYTTEEIMKLGAPIMSFDIGAPSERIKKYEKGIIIEKMTAEAVLNTLQNHQIIKEALQIPFNKQKVLFVVDEVTYSSRYRVDHLREQLLLRGISSDCITTKEVYKVNTDGYCSAVVYRCSDVRCVEILKKKCSKISIPLLYDIDDYIFDFSAIKDLSFLCGKEYKNFESYTKSIKNAMELCDGYITSTNNLAHVISETFNNKPVVINRNSASLEMVTISLSNIKSKHKNIVLGYFSGSNTHNADFEMIKPILFNIMKENSNVELLIGGQIKLSSEFNDFKDRVKKFKFVDWKKLPYLIEEADINLMPLEDTFFHACKSENKWMEAALVNVPTIASWNNELSGVIHDGVDGYLCKNLDEWNEKLKNMIDDESLRKNMAANAKKRVLSSYTTETIDTKVLKILNIEDKE